MLLYAVSFSITFIDMRSRRNNFFLLLPVCVRSTLYKHSDVFDSLSVTMSYLKRLQKT